MTGQARSTELSGDELNRLSQQFANRREPLFILFHSPLCGTCKLASRMLDIVEAADPTLVIYRCNINTAPQLAQRWRIGGIPALASIVKGEVADVLYRMESVDRMFSWLQLHRQTEKEENEHG